MILYISALALLSQSTHKHEVMRHQIQWVHRKHSCKEPDDPHHHLMIISVARSAGQNGSAACLFKRLPHGEVRARQESNPNSSHYCASTSHAASVSTHYHTQSPGRYSERGQRLTLTLACQHTQCSSSQCVMLLAFPCLHIMLA